MKRTKVNDKLKNVNKVPGLGSYTGDSFGLFKIQTFSYNQKSFDETTYRNIESFFDDVEKLHQDEVFWLNVIGINNEDHLRELAKYFDISKLHSEQILDITNSTDSYIDDNIVFSNLQLVYHRDEAIIKEKIAIYLKDNIVLTFQEEAGDVFDGVRQRIVNHEGVIRERSANYLYFSLIDAIVDYYLVVVRGLNERIRLTESKLYDYDNVDIRELFSFRKELSLFVYISQPFEEHITKLLESKLMTFDECNFYFNQLKSHISELSYETRAALDIVESITDLSLNITSYKMNKTVTLLTIFSAIFIPLSFIAGIFGMNFVNMPLIESEYGFIIFVVLSVLVSISMMAFILRSNRK